MTWSGPPDGVRLGAADAHVWLATMPRLTAWGGDFPDSLDEDERERARRFRFERDRRRFIAAHGWVRALLGAYLGLPPRRVRFTRGPYGKPSLEMGCGDGALRFNLSHSHERVLCAVARRRDLGVDIEYMRELPDAAQVAETAFSARERAALLAQPPSARHAAFYACWSRKEAYIKAIGRGLDMPLDRFDVTVSAAEPARLLGVADDPGEASRWELRDLPPIPGYAAALAHEGGRLDVACWEWDGPLSQRRLAVGG